MEPKKPQDFLEKAKAPRPGLARELLSFLADSRKWWLLPLLLILLLFSLLLLLGGSAAGPLIYPLF